MVFFDYKYSVEVTRQLKSVQAGFYGPHRNSSVKKRKLYPWLYYRRVLRKIVCNKAPQSLVARQCARGGSLRCSDSKAITPTAIKRLEVTVFNVQRSDFVRPSGCGHTSSLVRMVMSWLRVRNARVVAVFIRRFVYSRSGADTRHVLHSWIT